MSADVQSEMIPPRRLLRQCRRSRRVVKFVDSSGVKLEGGKALVGALAFRRVLLRQVLSADEQMVGVLLPPSVGGVVVNAALSLSRRVAVNLNYTMSDEVVNLCIRDAGLRRVLTSRRFLEKRPMELDAELVFVEDLKEQISGWDKAVAAFQGLVCPLGLLERHLGLTEIKPDDLLTVIFTSGSTGEPKGVMLSQSNVGSNIDGVGRMLNFDASDVLLGVLPFFHSFGYTGTLWLPLALDPKCVYHFNPLDAKTVGKLSEANGVTIILSTPTFLRTYIKRITPEQFHALNLVVVGAEKMPLELAAEFEEKYGFVPTEGYGTTELSPVAAFNVPETRRGDRVGPIAKLGSVGRVIPGTEARVVHPDTGDVLGLNEPGLLQISGPNVMLGYLNRPEKTAEAINDGWYDTGDVAMLDEHGFITITGRQSRFSKIGGEMVPHIRVEEELQKVVAQKAAEAGEEDEGALWLAVTAVPDVKKGERLVVVHRRLPLEVDELISRLSEAGLPNLWIPSKDSFIECEAVPILGSGKLDLKQLRDVAEQRFGPASRA